MGRAPVAHRVRGLRTTASGAWRSFVQHYNFQRPHQGLEGLTPADRFFRAAAPVRAAVEATVAANALRLAREQPPKLPFYLVGRLGDRELAISASGADLKVRVGDEETTIPMVQEAEHEDGTSIARWHGGAPAAEAAAPEVTEMAAGLEQAGCVGAQSLPAVAVGAVRSDTGDRGGGAGQDLARHVLPAGDARLARDAGGAEPAHGDECERGGGSVAAASRIAELETKVQRLEQDKRRGERLLMLTRKTLRAPLITGHRGRWPKALIGGPSTPLSPGANSP